MHTEHSVPFSRVRKSLRIGETVGRHACFAGFIAVMLPACDSERKEKSQNLDLGRDEPQQQLDTNRDEHPLPSEQMEIDGVRFAWVHADHESGFWITVHEVAEGAYHENHGRSVIDSVIKAGAFPQNWTVRRPTESEWNMARDQADARGLEDIDDGLGEVLDDGRIIGEADGFPKSAALGPLTFDMRDEATRIETSPQKVIIDPREGRIVIPAQYDSEPNFATRIVIAPTAKVATSNAEEHARPREQMEIDGVRFAWVSADHGSGFWITVEEVAAGPYAPDHGSALIEEIKKEGGFPENWSVRRPTEGEWKKARDQPPALGLENFHGGLGEVLDDGKIIGAADGFPKSMNLGDLIQLERVNTTRIMIKPERIPLDPRIPRGNMPAEFASETTFATRIVIVPVPTADSANPSR